LVTQAPRNGDRGELQYDNDFWRFSLAVYEPADVAEECLVLQDALGLDVNVLLFCAWLGTRAIVLGRSDIEAAARVVAPWHDNVVHPLRNVRRQIRARYGGEFENLRSRVKILELEAEQIEQAMLFAYAQGIESSRTSAGQRGAIAGNVNEYIAMMCSPAQPGLAAPFLIRAAQRLAQ
jgi:uncharacterized protein (TIGR02444 family)